MDREAGDSWAALQLSHPYTKIDKYEGAKAVETEHLALVVTPSSR